MNMDEKHTQTCAYIQLVGLRYLHNLGNFRQHDNDYDCITNLQQLQFSSLFAVSYYLPSPKGFYLIRVISFVGWALGVGTYIVESFNLGSGVLLSDPTAW